MSDTKPEGGYEMPRYEVIAVTKQHHLIGEFEAKDKRAALRQAEKTDAYHRAERYCPKTGQLYDVVVRRLPNLARRG